MSKKQKKTLVRIILSAVLLVAAALIPVDGIVKLVLFLIPYAVIGWDVLWKAIRNIAHGQVFDENFLMAIATVGAFALGEYPEGVAVMLFYQVGELFQSYAVGRSRQSIAALMDIRPDYANIEQDGKLVQVDPEDVAVGDTIVIKAGEKIPLDGVVLEGSSAVDTAALTGESLPRDVDPGDDVVSGCINQSGLLKVRVTKVFGESTVAKILDLVENSSSKKARAVLRSMFPIPTWLTTARMCSMPRRRLRTAPSAPRWTLWQPMRKTAIPICRTSRHRMFRRRPFRVSYMTPRAR